MAVLIDSANVAFGALSGGTPNPNPFNCTCGAGDNRLLVCAMLWSSTITAPTPATYNGVALTYIGSGNDGNVVTIFWHYMDNPPTGASHPVSITFGGGVTASGSLAGCDLTRAPVLGTNSGDSSYTLQATTHCVATGGGANDLYIAGTVAGGPLTSSGAPQVPVIANQNSINAGISGACASIPGSSAGNFSWTFGSSNEWDALGVTVFAVGATAGPAARCIYVMP